MEVLVLGTAAAEGWPALSCHCDACHEARRLGGKNLRSRSGYMIGETVKIDFGPDSMHHSLKYGLDYGQVRHLLVSHSHADHWVPPELSYRRPGFSLVPEESVMTVYGNEKVRAKLEDGLRGDLEKCRIRFVTVEPFQTVELDGRMTATPLRADHDRSEVCLNWLVESNGRAFLQGHDTGLWGEECWDYLKGKRLDASVWDCTHGYHPQERNHMGAGTLVKVKERLSEQGTLDEGSRFIATHFSHNGKWLHSQLEEFFAPHGIEVAYDGMKLNV